MKKLTNAEIKALSDAKTDQPKTLEWFQAEYDRLCKWRDLWTRLANRDSAVYPQKGNSGARRSANAVFLATLQRRDEAVQRRAKIADNKIGDLMRRWDAQQTAVVKNETNNAEIVGKARECGKCAELEAENGKLQKRIEFIKEVRSCDIHKTERSWVGWGCPDCMRELRQRNAELERENKAHTDLIKFFRNNMCIADTADYDFIRKEFQLWIDRANDQWEVERDLIECTMGAERYAKFTAELEKENETLRRNKDVDYGFYIPPTNSDEILRSAEIYERVERLVRENAELENRVASFQLAQSKIVGELKRRGDDELISKVNEWVHEPLPENRRIKHGGR